MTEESNHLNSGNRSIVEYELGKHYGASSVRANANPALANPPTRIGSLPKRYGSLCSRLFKNALSQSKMTGITGIGFLGAAIIALQVGLFIVLVKSSQQVRMNIEPLRQRLKQSLSEFHDQFSDRESNIVAKARERFVQARKKIERVDTSLIVFSVLSEE